MFGLFKKKPPANFAKYKAVADTVLTIMMAEKALYGGSVVKSDNAINGMAVGYVYGLADCALQIACLEIRNDTGKGMILALLRQIDTKNGGRGFDYLMANLSSPDVFAGMTLGGDAYNEWVKSEGTRMPHGWKSCI